MSLLLVLSQLATTVISACPAGEALMYGSCQTNDISELNSFAHFQKTGVETYLRFYYEFPPVDSPTQNMTMMIVTNQPYWFSFALGSNMATGDMWIFVINEAAQNITPIDGFGQNYNGPSYDVDYGGENNLVLLGYSYNSTLSIVKFQRLMNTGDQYDMVIKQAFQSSYLAYGVPQQYNVGFHQQNCATFSFSFVQGRKQIVTMKKDWMNPHKWVNLFCWGILVEIPMILARYFKTYKWYIWVHGMLLTAIVFTSLVAEGLMIYSYDENYIWDNFNMTNLQNQVHLVLGTTITIMIFVQLCGGWILNYMITEKLKVKNELLFSKKFHMVTGMFIYLIAKFNLVIGVLMMASNMKFSLLESATYLVLLITLVIRILLEYLHRTNSKLFMVALRLNPSAIKSKSESFDVKTSITSVNKLLNHIELLEFDILDQEFGNKKWCIFNNSVINLTDQLHPGGQFIWEQCQGREISRFIYGAYGLECTTLPPYKHSEYAIKMLEKLTVGTLRLVPLFSEELIGFNTWRLSGRQDFSNYLTMFEFQKQGITFMTTLNGIENFGRHFLLKSTRNDSISCRPYTMVLSMARPNQEFRKVLISACAQHLNAEELKVQTAKNYIFQSECEDFPLVIKRYPTKTGFSQYVHSLEIGDLVDLSGPYGTSFGINHQEEGQIVLIAGGTGLIPFLDLMDFILKKTIIQIIGSKAPFNLNPSGILYDKYFKPTFKIILMLCVQSKDDLVGSDIFLTLAKLQKYLSVPNFEMILSMNKQDLVYEGVQSVGKVRFDPPFLNKHLKVREIARVLVCGPPGMNLQVPAGLASLGVNRNRIHLV